MFGLGDNQQHNNDDPAMLDNVKQLVDDPKATSDDNASSSSPVPDTTSPLSPPSNDSSSDDTSAQDAQSAHAEPAQGFSSGPLPDKPTEKAEEPEEKKEEAPKPADPIAPAITPATPVEPKPTETPSASPSLITPKTVEPASPDGLAQLKEEALGHLEPLVEHLGGTPEEVFKTTMMMIQANDNHKLIQKALDAAKDIEDDKVRAKAMLDIINEINYFSQGVKTD